MIIKSFVFNPLYENTYVLYDDSAECIIVDPGCYEKYEQIELTNWIEQNNLKPVAVINTHCHVDHVLGNYFVKNFYNIPFYIPRGEEQLLLAVKSYASNYGFSRYTEAIPDQLLDESEFIRFGNSTLRIFLCPGHSPGHFIFFHPESKQAIVGDVIFKESIGRTDLPGGNLQTLTHSIKTKVYTLTDDVVLFPGHGPHTSVGHEAMHNPFVTR